MTDLVSVIVPVYNAMPYLARCVESLLRQTHPALQVILVDDGSTDAGGGLCDELAEKDSRVQVIHQPNSGVAAARNAGLDAARGDWIAFVDSDDYVADHFIAELLGLCRTHDCDCAACLYTSTHDPVRVESECFTAAARIECISGREAVIRHFGRDADRMILTWNKLYRSALWRELRYPVGKINEDLFVSHALLYGIRRLCLTDARLYAYYQSPGSLMRRPFSLRRLDVLDAYREGVLFYERVGEPELADIGRRVYCNRLLDACGVLKREMPGETEALAQLRAQAAETYRAVRRIPRFIDIGGRRRFAYRVKQWIGRYLPGLYARLFVGGRRYI